jgi:predicted AAA+ superfamily ATPase
MIARRLQNTLTAALAEVPAVVLLGPRQVGKTTLARSLLDKRPAVYLDLESDADRTKLSDPEAYLAQHADKLVILDEIQRAPDLFRNLRGLIDAGRRDGRACGRVLFARGSDTLSRARTHRRGRDRSRSARCAVVARRISRESAGTIR